MHETAKQPNCDLKTVSIDDDLSSSKKKTKKIGTVMRPSEDTTDDNHHIILLNINEGDQDKVIEQKKPVDKTITQELNNSDEAVSATLMAPTSAKLSPRANHVQEIAITP